MTTEIPVDVRPHPAEEVIAIIGQCAHVDGGDVQQMRIEFGRIGDTAAQARPRLHENDLDRTAHTSNQLNCGDQATRTPADDCDGGLSGLIGELAIYLSGHRRF